VLDQFARIGNPTAAQRAEAVIAAQRCASSGGRIPEMGTGAKAIIDAWERSLGLRGEEDE
jgi:hypothetical protein